jgi:hypothetical protein
MYCFSMLSTRSTISDIVHNMTGTGDKEQDVRGQTMCV